MLFSSSSNVSWLKVKVFGKKSEMNSSVLKMGVRPFDVVALLVFVSDVIVCMC